MNAPVDVGTEVAALHFYLATAKRQDHDYALMFGEIAQHRDAFLGSAVEEAWIVTLGAADGQLAALAAGCVEECPDCGALPGEPCHMDCSSRWETP